MSNTNRADIEFFAKKYHAQHLGKMTASFVETFAAGDFAARLQEMGIKAELVTLDRFEHYVTWP